MKIRTIITVLALTSAALPPGAHAQAPAAAAPAAAGTEKPFVPPKKVDLKFDREVYEYPADGRRDPFKPLLSANSGPQFSELTLTGTIVMPRPAESVATFRDLNKKDYRLRRGDKIGNATIVDIGVNRVVFSIEEFGMRRQEVMEIKLLKGGA
jgi:hypothetical protein